MKRMRIMGLCLVAAFAISLVAASFASADNPPEFTTKSGVSVVPVSTGPVKYETAAGWLGAAYLEASKSPYTKIKCQDSLALGAPTNGHAEGEVTGPKTTINNITYFTGCQVGAYQCNSAGALAGEIVTNNLDGELGDITTNVLPGLRLYPASGTVLAKFECAGGAIKVEVGRAGADSLIGELSGASALTVAANVIPTSMKLTFKEAAKGKQKVQNFVSGTPEQLESEPGTGWEKAGQAGVVTVVSVPVAKDLGVTK